MPSTWKIVYRGKRCYSHETGQCLERRCKVYVYCIARKVILDPEENWIPWPKLSNSDKVRWYFTDEIRINRDTRYSELVVCIRIAWIPRETPCILDISCFRVSRKYAYNVGKPLCQKYQQRKHRPLPIHLINITVTRSRFGSCRVIVQKDRSILYEWRMHSL